MRKQQKSPSLRSSPGGFHEIFPALVQGKTQKLFKRVSEPVPDTSWIEKSKEKVDGYNKRFSYRIQLDEVFYFLQENHCLTSFCDMVGKRIGLAPSGVRSFLEFGKDIDRAKQILEIWNELQS